MFGPWTPLAVFVAGFLLVIFLTRWITRHMQGIMFLLGADEEVIMYLQFILFFPGILVHEVSHWITAQLLGVRTLHFSIWPKKKGKGKVQYGAGSD
jgi:elongation factor P hydroxylase